MRAFIKYYVFWLLFFIVQKPLFMLANISMMGDIVWQDWFLVAWHALPLDLSVASYIMVFWGLLMTASYFVPTHTIVRIGNIYTYVLLLLTVVIFGTDIGVYPSWGFHTDKTLLIYLASPKAVLACATWWVWVLGISAMLAGWVVSCLAYRYWMRDMQTTKQPDTRGKQIGAAIGMFLVTGLLILPIRGSVTTSTMNTGRVYFSENRMLNQAAVNPIFNIIESMSVPEFDTRRYTYMPSEKAKVLVEELLPERNEAATMKVLNCERPNIVFFILESFSQNAWDAMPNLQRLAEKGVYFSHVAASSFRTDRGVVATLSGFPGQPTSSLMVVPSKTKHLPNIGKSLSKEGYALKFWYGGDEDFTSMRSYLVDGGFVERVNDHSFPVSERLSKWGVHDHILFRMAAEEISSREDSIPHLDVVLSLSSHEPFEVPATRRFEDIYLNSIAYTDSCIGAFAETLRKSPAWGKTLLVFVADHGFPHPSGVQNYEPLRYAIPVVWAGGAVENHRVVETISSQIDVVPTLLAQMGIEHSEYVFGKDVLDSTVIPFAFYSFNDGFALLTDRDTVVVDAKVDQHIIGQNDETETLARAFVQRIMEAIEEL